jgi:hypothetical protein
MEKRSCEPGHVAAVKRRAGAFKAAVESFLLGMGWGEPGSFSFISLPMVIIENLVTLETVFLACK